MFLVKNISLYNGIAYVFLSTLCKLCKYTWVHFLYGNNVKDWHPKYNFFVQWEK